MTPRINQRGVFKAEVVNDDGTVSGTLVLRNNQIWPAVIQETKIKAIADKMIGRQYTVIVSQAVSHSLIRCLIEDQLIGTNGTFIINQIIDLHRASGSFKAGSGTYNDAELLIPDQELTHDFCHQSCHAIVTGNDHGTIICNLTEGLYICRTVPSKKAENDSDLFNGPAGEKGFVIIRKFQKGKNKYGRGTLTVNGVTYENVCVEGFKGLSDKEQYIGKSFQVIVNQYDPTQKTYICSLTDKDQLLIAENKSNSQVKNISIKKTNIDSSLLHSCVEKYLLLKEKTEIENHVNIRQKKHGFDLDTSEKDVSLRHDILTFFDRNTEIVNKMTDSLTRYTYEIEKHYRESFKG